MKVFELIKSVLDDTYGDIRPPQRETILAGIQQLSSSYSDLTKKDPPNYADPVTRFAYIYKYTTCHANIVAEKISAIPELSALFAGGEGSWANVACIGGGPGSEFLGVIKHKIISGQGGGLKCFLLDKEQAWGDTWSDVDQRTETLKFRVSTHFQQLDIASEATWRAQARYLSADLFTFVYFVSEVYKKMGHLQKYLCHLFEKAKPGALFLFIDNNVPAFYGPFDALAAQHLDLLFRDNERYVIDSGEQKTDLEPYFSLLGHQPKLQTSIAWRVYQKPKTA